MSISFFDVAENKHFQLVTNGPKAGNIYQLLKNGKLGKHVRRVTKHDLQALKEAGKITKEEFMFLKVTFC